MGGTTITLFNMGVIEKVKAFRLVDIRYTLPNYKSIGAQVFQNPVKTTVFLWFFSLYTEPHENPGPDVNYSSVLATDIRLQKFFLYKINLKK